MKYFINPTEQKCDIASSIEVITEAFGAGWLEVDRLEWQVMTLAFEFGFYNLRAILDRYAPVETPETYTEHNPHDVAFAASMEYEAMRREDETTAPQPAAPDARRGSWRGMR